MVGQVLDPFDRRERLAEHRLNTIEHCHLAHRAAVAAATHCHVGGALTVVAYVGDETTVGSQRRVDLGRHQRLDLGRQRVVAGEPLDAGRLGSIGIADDKTLRLGYGLFVFAPIAAIIVYIWTGLFPVLSLIAILPAPLALFSLSGAIKHGEGIGAYPQYLAANVATVILMPLLLGISLIYG